MAKADDENSTAERRPPFFGEREPVIQLIAAHLGPGKTGRPENFDASAAGELKAALEAEVCRHKGETGRDLLRKQADFFVQEQLEARGLRSSNRIVRRRVVTPVFKKLGLLGRVKRPKRFGPGK
jgi:hypothetical protein